MSTMRRLIGQLEEATDRPAKHGPMSAYNWKAVASAMGGKLMREPKGKDVPAQIFYKNVLYSLTDNGGEINISKSESVGESVPFWSNAHPGGSVGPETLAYRLAAEIAGNAIDYELNLDEGVMEAVKNDASASFVLLLAVQSALMSTFTKENGWRFEIDGVRAGGRQGQTSDEYTLHGVGPNRTTILVSSSNDRKEHMAIAQVIGTSRKKMIWENVKKGDAKKIAAWVLKTTQADPKFGDADK